MSADLAMSAGRLYRTGVLDAMPRLLGQLDREALSPTWGSFDRDHWAWKFRDFPVTMLQAGVLPLAWLWRDSGPGNPIAGQPRALEWIQGALEAILLRQHRNGAFDTVAPNSQDHGVTLAQCYVLVTTAARLGPACPAPLTSRIAEALRRGAAFAGRSDEDYAFITNHHALFALAFLRMGRFLGDRALEARAGEVVAEILARQSPDGWYAEYGGPDPGYESLTLQHLAEFEAECPTPGLAGSVDRSLAFLAHCVHPDGGIGGGYASRYTRQWFPAGFELLARRSGVARGIAEFVRPRLTEAAVVTPRTVDAHNLPLLLHSWCLAADAAGAAGPAAEPLPCQQTFAPRHFPGADLVVTSTPRYYAVAALARGGALVVHDKATATLAWEDAGYVAETAPGRRRWSSAVLGLSQPGQVGEGRALARARFGHTPRPVLTPGRFLLLRLLNLTVFRSRMLGALVRRRIVAQLITARRPGRLHLERTIEFGPDRLAVRDRLSGGYPGVRALWLARAFTTVHMGSARYFHPADLNGASDRDLSGAAGHLAGSGAAELEWRTPVPPAGAADDPLPPKRR